MINPRNLLLSLRIQALVCCFCFTCNAWADGNDKRNFDISKNIDIFSNLFKELDRYYVDSIPVEKMVENGINAMLSQIDPYTTYISSSERGDFETMTTGEYGGIGSLIQQNGDSVLIAEPYEGMPALEAGLRAGDVILKIDTTSMIGKTTAQVSERLRGKPGSTFTLTLGRKGVEKPFQVKITRRKILLNAVPYYGMITDSIGYIFLNSFTDKAAKEVRAALLDLQKNPNFKGLVLDLRNNPGGILEDAVEIVNLFIPKGKTVLSTRGKIKAWDKVYKTTQEPIAPDLPLAVLVNSGSASASEIVSGALQDLDRAVIIGKRTFGKGLVQTTRPISFDGLLKVTTAKYYIPSGRLIQAIDYSNRNPDGSVGRTPDSLTQVFFTENQRPVRDGGGVTPDRTVTEDKLPNIIFYLVGDQLVFDFANDFAASHTSIGALKDFQVTDSVYQQFKEFVVASNFTYDRESDKILKKLMEVAQFEGYDESAAAEFKALEEKLKHDVSRDLETFKPQIREILSQQIVRRFFHQKGEIQEMLKTDETLDEAISILEDPTAYHSILNDPKDKK